MRQLKRWVKGSTILIRNYKTNVSEFLLYPTVSYALKDDYLDSFQEEYQNLSSQTLKRRVIKFSLNTSQLWRKWPTVSGYLH